MIMKWKFWIGITGLTLLAGMASADASYTTIAVDEYSGYPRSGWPVHVGVPLYGDLATDDLWLARVDDEEELVPIAFQVIDTINPAADIEMGPRLPIRVVDLVFMTDLEAYESARFRLYYGEAAAERPTAGPVRTLTVETGDLLERTVDTGAVRYGFHDLSGQLLNYTMAGSDEMVHFTIPNRKRPIHHNPDIWSLPGAWGHASGWNVTETEFAPAYQESAGPLMWRSVRTGAMPRSKDVETSVIYTAYAGLPFLFQSSSMRFTANIIVNAVRNNELVFSRGFQTHGVYIDHAWKTHTLRAYNPEDPEENFRHINQNILPPDIPFIGLYHETRRDGMGIVTLDRYVHNPEKPVSGSGTGAHYYFNDGQIHRDTARNFTYFCRAEVFNYAWGANWNSSIIPAGAVFAENSVFLAFPVGVTDDGQVSFEEVERWTRWLRNPPRIWVKDGVDWRSSRRP